MATGRGPPPSVLLESSDVTGYSCSICQARDRREVESTNYCVDCHSNMCEACTSSHASLPNIASHQVVDISRAPGKHAQNLQLRTQTCDEHQGKLLDRYCECHDELACETCVNLKHRSCIQLKCVPTFAKGISKTERFKDSKLSTEKLLESLRQRRSEMEETIQRLDKAETQSQQEATDQAKQLHMYIDEPLKSESAKITSKYKDKMGAVQKKMLMINDFINTTETINEKLITFAAGENESELFVYMKQGENNEKDARPVIDTMCQTVMEIPTYRVNSTMERSLKDEQSLGEFETTVVVTLNNVVYVKDASDCVLNITGICILPDASLILADRMNMNIKHMDASYRVVSCLDMALEPCCVCYINNNEVAVTLDEVEEVQFVRVGLTLENTRSFPVNGRCAGICYSENELFLCCENIKGPTGECVRVYDLPGTILRTIQHDPTGQPLFHDLLNITISPCGRKLHITDRDKGVLTIDRAGNLLSTYTDPDSVAPDGICTLENGDLLVCDSDYVLHISKDGKKRGVVLKRRSGQVVLQTLCFDSVQSRLIVFAQDCCTMNVYDVHLDPQSQLSV